MQMPNNKLIACSFADYKKASQNQIPERWLRVQERSWCADADPAAYGLNLIALIFLLNYEPTTIYILPDFVFLLGS